MKRATDGDSELLDGPGVSPAEVGGGRPAVTPHGGVSDFVAQLPMEAAQLAERVTVSLITTSVAVVQETGTLLSQTSEAVVSVVTAPVRSVLSDVRSVSGYTQHRILSAAQQRLTVYHPREAEIARTAQSMAAEGKSEEEIARWAVDARNRLRKELREKGDPLVDSVASLVRRDHDMPTYEKLRESGKTDAEIIASAARSNHSVDTLAVVATEAAPAVDAGLAVLDELIIHTAASSARRGLAAQEAERSAGAISGGQAGEVAGSELGAQLGKSIPGIGPKLIAGLASVIGGIDGAIQGGREKD